MWHDPIVNEVRAIRDAHARLHKFDLDRIFLDLKEQELRSGRTFLKLRSRHPPEKPEKNTQS
jgi:hypothetical protein